ncbi:MAG TPA: DNA-binding response regulator, partial [Gammaproteobacteria bacterium]|nr:DNA-binding response regulator [Gammaproteobacteria bacterium]
KLVTTASAPRLIKTVWGGGYKLVSDVKAQ